VALWHASTWSTHAPAQLAEILRTMSAEVVDEASVVVNLRGKVWRAADIAADDQNRELMLKAIEKL